MGRHRAIARVGVSAWAVIVVILLGGGLWMVVSEGDVAFGLLVLGIGAMGLSTLPQILALTSSREREERDAELVRAATSNRVFGLTTMAFALFGAAGGWGLAGPLGALIGALVGVAVVSAIRVFPRLLVRLGDRIQRTTVIGVAVVCVAWLVGLGVFFVAIGYGIGGRSFATGMAVVQAVAIVVIIGTFAIRPRRDL